MSKDKIIACLRQGEGPQEMIMELEMPKVVADKIGEIRKRNPKKWEHREWDLMDEAEKELGLPLK